MFDLAFGESTWIWITIAIVAAIVEVSVPHFGVIFVALGGVVAAAAAALGFDITVQLLACAIALGLSFFLLRPRMVARMGSPGVPSRTETLVGRVGIVTHDVDATVGAGRVNVGGEDWAARSAIPIPAGTRVRVVGADGIVLEIRPA